MKQLALIRDVLLNALAVVASVAVVLLMMHVGLDVLFRTFINAPIPATYEIVTNYYMIAMAFIPLAWVERRNGMVTVGVVDPLLPVRITRYSDQLVAVISTVIYGALAWFTLKPALSSFASGTFVLAQSIPIPVWPAYFLPPTGFGIAALVTFIRIFVDDADNRQ